MRGNETSLSTLACEKGTPPRMRGKPLTVSASPQISGNTPAYAGKTLRRFPNWTGIKEHPRVCGKTDLRNRHVVSPEGNTPAYAGKTTIFSPAGTGGWEHPRVCGENLATEPRWSCRLGTPPRMRGKLMRGTTALKFTRNTPAYAGKTLHDQHVYRTKPDFSITLSGNKTRQWIPKPSGTAAES